MCPSARPTAAFWLRCPSRRTPVMAPFACVAALLFLPSVAALGEDALLPTDRGTTFGSSPTYSYLYTYEGESSGRDARSSGRACEDIWPASKCQKHANKGRCHLGKMQKKCKATCGLCPPEEEKPDSALKEGVCTVGEPCSTPTAFMSAAEAQARTIIEKKARPAHAHCSSRRSYSHRPCPGRPSTAGPA